MASEYWISLPPKLAEYRDRKPTKSERQAENIDGSGVELQIITVLVRKDWPDEEILDYCDFHDLPRHMEDSQKDGSSSGTLSRVATARGSVLSHSSSSVVEDRSLGESSLTEELPPTPPHVIESEHNPGVQTYASQVLRWLALQVVSNWDEKKEIHKLTKWRHQIIEESAQLTKKPVSIMTARRLTAALVESGYVELERLDGRSLAPHLTEKGRQALTPIYGNYRRTIFLKRKGRAVPLEELDDEQVLEYESEISVDESKTQATTSTVKVQKRDPRHLHIEGYRKNNDLNGYYRLRFAGPKIRYIQLLAPFADIRTAPMWLNLPVGFDQEGLPLFTTIVANEDLAQDPLLPLMPDDLWRPKDQFLLPALELTRTKTGFAVAQHLDEAGQLQPSVGVIRQSAFNFFAQLYVIEPNGRIIQVKGTGRGKKRRFNFEDVGEALPLDLSFDFDQFLVDMLDPRHLHRGLQLPKGWFHMPEQRRKLINKLTHEKYLAYSPQSALQGHQSAPKGTRGTRWGNPPRSANTPAEGRTEPRSASSSSPT